MCKVKRKAIIIAFTVIYLYMSFIVLQLSTIPYKRINNNKTKKNKFTDELPNTDDD